MARLVCGIDACTSEACRQWPMFRGLPLHYIPPHFGASLQLALLQQLRTKLFCNVLTAFTSEKATMKLHVAAFGAALLAVGWLRALAVGEASPTSGRPIVASLPPAVNTSAPVGSTALASKSTSVTVATTRSSVAATTARSSTLTSKSMSVAAATTRSSVAASIQATGGAVSQMIYRNASIGGAVTSATQSRVATQTQPVSASVSNYSTVRRDNDTIKVGSPSIAISTLPTTKVNRSASASGDGVPISGAVTSSRQATTLKAAATSATTTTAATVARLLASEKSSAAAGSNSTTAFKSSLIITTSTSTAKIATTTARLKMSLVGLLVNSSTSGDVGSTTVKSYIPSKAYTGMMFAITCSVIGQPVTTVSVVSSTGEKILECTASAEGKAYGTFATYLDSNLSSPSCSAALNASATNGSAAVTFYFTAADATLADGYYRCSATYWNGSSIVSVTDDQVWPFVTYIPPTSLFISPSPLTFIDGNLATVNCSTYAKPPADVKITVDCRECDFVSVTKVPQEINAFMPAGYSYAAAKLVAAAKWNGVKITCNVTNHQIFTNSITSSVAIQSATSIYFSSTEVAAAALVQTTSAANKETTWGSRLFCICAVFNFVYHVLHGRPRHL